MNSQKDLGENYVIKTTPRPPKKDGRKVPTPMPAPAPPLIQSPTKDMSLDWHPSRLKGSRMNGLQ